MKLKFRIILFSLVTFGYLVSFTSENISYPGGRIIDPLNSDTLIVNTGVRIDSFGLMIIPPSSGVRFYKDGIVFLSSSKNQGKMINDQISFGKIDAQYAILSDSALESYKVFSPGLPFTYPCEATTFSEDFRTMYFTRYFKSEGVDKIFKADFSSTDENQGGWSFDENPVSFCADRSTYTHPALSMDGKMMIFASDKSGSIGGLDLFVTLNKNGTWSDPVNLGDAVNSRSNELFPYLDSENNLFYSSNGIQGFGGYDIYVCKFKGNTWEKPINLSIPVNTKYDDVAFTLDRKDGKTAFYTVKQNAGKRSVQLFKIALNSSTSPDKVSTLSQFFTNPAVSSMVILATEPAVQATDRRAETARQRISPSRGENDIVVYRVQFMTSFNPRTRSQVTVNGKDYNVFEYLLDGAYRLCMGEFSSLSSARELENTLRQSDYPQATVVAFVNNVRSLDPELFKEEPGPVTATVVDKTITKPLAEAKPSDIKTQAVIKDLPVPEAQPAPAEIKAETAKKEIPKTSSVKTEPAVKTTIPEATEKKDLITYRVQILSSGTKKGSYKITINNKIYNTFEYSYSGSYRTCVGEFSTLAPAKEFQAVCRNSGHPQAFVVAFKNNIRSTDPALFK